MKLKKTITPEPKLNATHEIPYICYQEGYLQIQVKSKDESGKQFAEEVYKIMPENMPEPMITAIEKLERVAADYILSLPKYEGAEEII